jgi:peptidyl-prolyl cis-trans isomerase C
MKSRLPLIITAALVAALCSATSSILAQEQVVATVDGKAITETDLKFAEREFGIDPNLATTERRRILAELLIQRQIVAAEAERAKLNNGKDFEERLAYARHRVLQQLLLEKRARDSVTESDARRFYDEQSALTLEEEEVRIRHILSESEAVAKTVRAEIAGGADFATLAKALSTDLKTAQRGGDLGWRVKGELPDKLATAAFALQKKGDLSPPVETEAGWHVIQLEERRVRTVPEFAALKHQIIRILVRNKTQEFVRGLREKATIVYLDRSLQPVEPTAGAASPASPHAGALSATVPSAAPRSTATVPTPTANTATAATATTCTRVTFRQIADLCNNCTAPPWNGEFKRTSGDEWTATFVDGHNKPGSTRWRLTSQTSSQILVHDASRDLYGRFDFTARKGFLRRGTDQDWKTVSDILSTDCR